MCNNGSNAQTQTQETKIEKLEIVTKLKQKDYKGTQ